MAAPVVTIATRGLPVTDAYDIGLGLPVEEAANGFGLAITFVQSGGFPVLPTAASFAPNTAPSGFHWEYVTSAANGGARVKSAANGNQPVVSLRAN